MNNGLLKQSYFSFVDVMNVEDTGLVRHINTARFFASVFLFLISYTRQNLHGLNRYHKMGLTIPDIDLPDWEVLHVYQVEEKGEGKCTILLLRRTASTGEPFAVCKIMTLSNYQRSADKIQNEADALAKIPPHPNIIKLHSTHADVPCAGKESLILEFCAGEDLESLSQHAKAIQRRIPEVFLWHVLRQALGALEHLARSQISHQDIHSGNILLRPAAAEATAYPDVVLADFEYSDHTAPDDAWAQRLDIAKLGLTMRFEILHDTDSIADGSAPPYSPALRAFVETLSGGCATWLAPVSAELRTDLIPLAAQMAAEPPQMPPWMAAYFVERRRKAVPGPAVPSPQEQGDSAAGSGTRGQR